MRTAVRDPEQDGTTTLFDRHNTIDSQECHFDNEQYYQ
jgi:hypothetical protein